MVKRILGVLGWLGVGFVFAAVAIRLPLPSGSIWFSGLALAGLVCMLLYVAEPVARDRRVSSPAGRRATARCRRSACWSCSAILVGINYLVGRQNKRWDLTAAGQFTLSDQTQKVLRGSSAGQGHGLRRGPTDFERVPRSARANTSTSKQMKVEYIDPDKQPGARQAVQVQRTARSWSSTRAASSASRPTPSRTSPTASSRRCRAADKVYFIAGHGETDTTAPTSARLQRASPASSASDNFAVETLVARAAAGRARRTRPWS